MSNRVAIIDLGSNTFHLLIAQFTDDGFIEIFRRRDFVFLARGGVDKIDPDRMEHGERVMEEFARLCDKYEVDEVHAVGTSALRSASNAGEFINKVLDATGMKIEVISGEREAQLIHKGCVHFLNLGSDPYLIMDIGGGSVEFIGQEPDREPLMASFTMGISYLRSELSYSSPMSKKEYGRIQQWMTESFDHFSFLEPMDPPLHLVGASGPFEILESLQGLSPRTEGNIFPASEIWPHIKEILFATLEERFAIEGMQEERADLSLESMLLVSVVLKQLSTIKNIVVTPYALKEGYLIDKYF